MYITNRLQSLPFRACKLVRSATKNVHPDSHFERDLGLR